MKIIKRLPFLALCFVLLEAESVSQNARISWSELSGGFSRAMASNAAITMSLAQRAVGTGATSNHRVSSGFLVYPFGGSASIGTLAWTQLSGGLPTTIHYSLMTDGNTIFAGNSSSSSPRLWRSIDNGTTWSAVSGMPSTGIVWALSNLGGTLFAGTWGSGLYRSTNGGTLWTRADTGMSHNDPRGFTRNGSYIFTCAWGGGVYRSSDNGSHWTAASSGITGGGLWPIHVMGNYIFVGGQVGGVFRSSNNGNSWQAVNTGLTNTIAYALASIENELFVGTGGASVFKSTDYGNTWSPASNGMPSQTVYALLTINSILVAGTDNAGVYVSTNRGASWTAMNNGLSNTAVFSLAVNHQYLFAGTSNHVFRAEHGQTVLSVPRSIELPTAFHLSQNYPNPFNPRTRINFQIPNLKPQIVSLKVYDVLGREVATLVSEYLQPGSYEVTFNADGLASGVYLYRFRAGEFTQTKRMVLLR